MRVYVFACVHFVCVRVRACCVRAVSETGELVRAKQLLDRLADAPEVFVESASQNAALRDELKALTKTLFDMGMETRARNCRRCDVRARSTDALRRRQTRRQRVHLYASR